LRDFSFGEVEFHVSPDLSDVELSFKHGAPNRPWKDSEIIQAAEQYWPDILRIIGVLTGIQWSTLRLSVPRARKEEYPNPEIATFSVLRTLQAQELSQWHWKTVSGLLTMRTGLIRSADDDYVDLYIHPTTKYKGQSAAPFARDQKTRDLLVSLRLNLAANITHLVQLDFGDGSLVAELAMPLFEKDTPLWDGGPAFVYKGIITV
jgi:hypothetical protein